MILLGEKNTLTALRHTSVGMFLGDAYGNDVLLPNKFVPENLREGDSMEVFVYTDSEDRIVATTQQPALLVNQFGYLQVKALSNFGAFLDWGLDKDLLVPFREQPEPLKVGQWTAVYLRLDLDTERLVGSCKVNRFLEQEPIGFQEGQEVKTFVYERSDLGFNAILDDRYRGLIYANEIFQPLRIGSVVRGFIKTIRDDGGIDVVLQKPGYQQAVDTNAGKILDALRASGGFLPLSDASEPALIYSQFGMSKKNFKKVVGTLYRERKVRLADEGIYLV